MRHVTLAAGWPLATGRGWRQVGELLLAFVLASLIGLERQLRGKSAGLRTQAIVGTSAALIVLVSKYGFGDVLASGRVILDPSRVAAQIVSGVGFLGAGLILTRQGAVRGLTTAAAVWETAAIRMAAGAGLPLLAGVVTVLHGQGILRRILSASTSGGWAVSDLTSGDAADSESEGRTVEVAVGLSGSGNSGDLLAQITDIPGVLGVEFISDDEID